MTPPWFYQNKEDKLFRYINELENEKKEKIYDVKYHEAIKGAKLAILLNRLGLSRLWIEF